jgi:hypothetical protein
MNWNLMRRVSITKNDSTTNSVPREKIVLEGMRRIFETTLEPSHSDPLKKAIDNLDNLNKNAEVSVPQSSPLSPFFSQHHQPHFF